MDLDYIDEFKDVYKSTFVFMSKVSVISSNLMPAGMNFELSIIQILRDLRKKKYIIFFFYLVFNYLWYYHFFPSDILTNTNTIDKKTYMKLASLGLLEIIQSIKII